LNSNKKQTVDQDEGEDVEKIDIGKNIGRSRHTVIENSDSDDDENFHQRREENDMSCLEYHQSIMYGAEKIFRIMFLFSAVFVLGASRGQSILNIASKVLEYSCVAWFTCLGLISLCSWQHHSNEHLGDWPERIRLLSEDRVQMMETRQHPIQPAVLQASNQSR